MKSVSDRFWAKVAKGGESDCWRWLGCIRPKAQHGVFRMEGKLRSAHSVALILSGSDRVGDLWALHSCDNAWCVNPGHLRWGTPFDNVRDMHDRGRLVTHPGARNPCAKIDEAAALEIYALRHERQERGCRAQAARKFCVSERTISDIWDGFSWSSVTGAKNTRPSRAKQA